MEAIARGWSASGEDWGQWMPRSAAESTPYLLTVIMATVLLYLWSDVPSSYKKMPLVNPSPSMFTNIEAKRTFLESSQSLMDEARAKFPNQPYRLTTDFGEVVMLPPDMADEIRNEPKLSFNKATFVDFHGDVHGFEPFGENRDQHLTQTVARKQLTKLLGQVTKPLSEEAALAFLLNFGDSQEWHEVTIKPALLDLVARMSSRVFLGDQLCRNDDWLRVTKNYTVVVFEAAARLRVYPRLLRPLVSRFLPICQKAQEYYEEARREILPVIGERRRLQNEAVVAGKPIPQFNDALDWFEQEALAQQANYDPGNSQLILSVAAIHTTTDLLVQVMVDLAKHPELFEPLREEIAGILQTAGWHKTSLYQMKLLDSVIKESQRMKPISISSMRRMVVDDFKLSNGLELKKGMRVNVDSYRMWDPSVHQEPLKWDGYRFYNMRSEASGANKAQFVSTSADHIAFGHGEHACPGRFFASNELKVALCHMLMKYDWKLAPGTDTKPLLLGFSHPSNPWAKVMLRRREKMEIDIDCL